MKNSKKIIATIDEHIFEIDLNAYNAIFDSLQKELKGKGMHWDDSPFGSMLHLCDASELDDVLSGENEEKHYWTKRIIEKKKIHKKFDLQNYIRRTMDKPLPVRKHMTAKERLENKRAEENLWIS